MIDIAKEREKFETWYKDNVPMKDHPPLTYAIATSSWLASAEANQLEIQRLRGALQLFLDAKYPEEQDYAHGEAKQALSPITEKEV